MDSIFHITTPTEWDTAVAAGTYVHPSLQSEGFIHMSVRDEVVATTERYYADQRGLILLEIDQERIPAGQLVWEMAPSVGREFPHSYGPLPVDAVVAIHGWDPDESGQRTAPPISR
jgi:uncharacterized protein (DUF952 family)